MLVSIKVLMSYHVWSMLVSIKVLMSYHCMINVSQCQSPRELPLYGQC